MNKYIGEIREMIDKQNKINGRHCRLHITAILGLLSLLSSGTAFAYLGPGAGLGMIGSLIAIVVVGLVVVLGLVIYPVRMMRKRKLQATADNVDSEVRDKG